MNYYFFKLNTDRYVLEKGMTTKKTSNFPIISELLKILHLTIKIAKASATLIIMLL